MKKNLAEAITIESSSPDPLRKKLEELFYASGGSRDIFISNLCALVSNEFSLTESASAEFAELFFELMSSNPVELDKLFLAK